MKSYVGKILKVTAPFTAILFVCLLLWLITGQAPPCIFHSITGFYCPGCGSGRMFLSIFRLDLYQAFRYNPAVFAMLPVFSVIFIIHMIAYLRNKKMVISKLEKAILIFLTVILILFGIARNLPIFTYLAPTVVS